MVSKRNEFHYKGRMLLARWRTEPDSPSNYGDVAGSLLIDIGIDEQAITQMALNTPDNYVLGGKLNGEVGLTVPDGDNYTTIGGNWMKFCMVEAIIGLRLTNYPYQRIKNKLIRFFGGEQDFLDDLSVDKWDYVNSTSYNQFLSERIDHRPRLSQYWMHTCSF